MPNSRRARAWTARAVACLLILLLCGRSGLAEDDQGGIALDDEAIAIAALLRPRPEAVRPEPTDEQLVALWENDGHDPWLLAVHAQADGRRDVALRIGARLRDADPESMLASVLDATPDAGHTAAHRATLRAAAARYLKGALEPALARLEPLLAEPQPSILQIRARELRGSWLSEAGRLVGALESLLAAGDDALTLGWHGRARSDYREVLGAGFDMGSYDLASRAAEGLRAVAEIQGTPKQLAGAEYNLALVSQLRGDLPRAIRHISEAMHLYDTLALDEHLADARSLRSHWYAEVGDFAEAMDEQDALARFFVDRPRDRLWIQNESALGAIRFRLGDPEGAIAAHTRALEAAEALEDEANIAQAHFNIGLVSMQGGRWSEGIAALERAWTGFEGAQDPFNLASTKSALGEALAGRADATRRTLSKLDDAVERKARAEARQADLERAHGLFAEALALAEDAGATHLVLDTRLAHAELLLGEGRLDEALAALTSVRSEATRLRVWHSHMRACIRLAQVHLQRDEPKQALDLAREAAKELARSFAGLAAVDLARARAVSPDIYDIGFTAAARLGRPGDALWFLEAGRGAALLRGLGGRAAALRASVPDELSRKREARTHARLLAFTNLRRQQRRRVRDRIREARKTYEEARRAEEEVVEAIQRVQDAAARRLAPPRLVDAGDLATRLRALGRSGKRTVAVLFNLQPREASALVVEGGEPRVVAYASETLGELQDALGRLVAARKGDLAAKDLDTLRRLLIEPLGLRSGPTRLVVSPDRDLSYAPLAAVLPDHWDVVWMPSATTLDLLAERRLRRGRAVLGLGNPDYSGVSNAKVLVSRGGPTLAPLPASEKEVEAVAGTPQDLRLLAADATEAGLEQALRGTAEKPVYWRSVHLACHGLIDVAEPAFCCLAITPGGGEDGLLTASEILRLTMRTDLAVLSACQTGRGRFVRGEGVMGLTRAFMFAGAPRVVVSLWDVEDRATAHLMEAFYAAWRGGADTAAALRTAQLAVRDHEVDKVVREPGKPDRVVKERPWSHPRYWAAWVLWGLPN